MIGLKEIPSAERLQRVYALLQAGGAVDEKQIALWSQWVRFDPRLGEQMVVFLHSEWRRIDALKLNLELHRQPWPAAMGVLLETAKLLHPAREQAVFGNWCRLVMSEVEPVSPQQFFIGMYALGGRRMFEEALKATDIYLTWGYLGKDLMVNKAPPLNLTLVPADRRRVVLQSMIDRGLPIDVETYRRELGYFVSRRQAQRDLKEHPQLKSSGFTRARKYRRL